MHTPGPWRADETRHIWTDAPEREKYGRLVGQAYKISKLAGSNEEGPDNARLMAAAPELLEALETLLTARDRYFAPDTTTEEGQRFEKARTAVNKAKGGES